MTRIAVISDIHANPFALEAVIDDIRDASVDEVLVGGDLVGRGPHGARVIDRIRKLGWPVVRGNHEDYLLSFRRGEVPDEWMVTDIWAASRWMADEIDTEHENYIDSLPFSRSPENEQTLRLFHGSPESHTDGIGDWTSDRRLQEHWDAIDEIVLACAHTHRPLVRDVASGLIVNVGSVGLPFNGDWRAQYAVFTKERRDWDVEFRQVEYDREAFLREYDRTGFLAEGGLTAVLLKMEVEEARPFLVPFLKWIERTEHSPDHDAMDQFLEVYDPTTSMGAFFDLLEEMEQKNE